MILSYSNFLQTPGLEKKRYLLAMMAMILVGFFWAVVETLGHYIPRGYSPIQTVWSRYLVHMLFMLAAFGPRKRTSLIRTDCLWMQISRALLMLGMPVCFIAGAAFLPIDVVWVVSWCAVTIELGLSAWILRERVRPGLWIAAASGWLGVWVMSGVDFPPLSWRYLAPVGMGSCFAVYVVMTRCMSGESTSTKLFHTALWVFGALSLIVPFLWKTPTPRLLVIYTLIGIIGFFCLFFLDKAIEMAPVSTTAPIIYTVPIWYCLQDCIIKGRPPGMMSVAGALIIVVSFVFFAMDGSSRRV